MQKTAYEMRISGWSSDVCSSDLEDDAERDRREQPRGREAQPAQRRLAVHADRHHREAVGKREGEERQPSIADRARIEIGQMGIKMPRRLRREQQGRELDQREPEDRKSVV